MKVKDLMIPVGEYKTVGADAKLSDVAELLGAGGHRDVIVVNADGDLEGVLTMTDILAALEPNYKKVGRKELATDVLTSRYVTDLFKQYDLWGDPLNALCKKAIDSRVGDVMYVPAADEYLSEEDDLAHAIHRYIVGTHQPLFVKSNGTITGLLRLSDIFEEIKTRMSACVLDEG